MDEDVVYDAPAYHAKQALERAKDARGAAREARRWAVFAIVCAAVSVVLAVGVLAGWWS